MQNDRGNAPDLASRPDGLTGPRRTDLLGQSVVAPATGRIPVKVAQRGRQAPTPRSLVMPPGPNRVPHQVATDDKALSLQQLGHPFGMLDRIAAGFPAATIEPDARLPPSRGTGHEWKGLAIRDPQGR